MKSMILTLLLGVSVFILSFSAQLEVEKKTAPIDMGVVDVNSPPCVQMFNSIEKYAEMYNIPKDFAYGIAYEETRYNGPFHWSYDHQQTSHVGALGPMQVMYPTAKGLFPNMEFDRNYLKTNIDFNVHCSMKLLRKLHDRFRDWKLVFGAYNTGRPMVNGYAIKVFKHKR